MLVLVIERVWATVRAVRVADVAAQDYLSPEGLDALGAMLGLEVALDN